MMKTKWYIKFFLLLAIIFATQESFGQDPTDTLPGDPGAFVVYSVQALNFGAFTAGATGGTITISNAGVRSTTGSVLNLNSLPYFNAIFEIDAPVGSIITIMNGPNITLNGSNGGTMSLSLGSSSPGSPFVTTVNQPSRTVVNIGGTLTVGSAASCPAGTYTGDYYITFYQD